MDNARPMAVILDALDRTHRRACGQTGIHYMSIPVNPERDADVILSDAIDELGRMRDAEAPLLARIAELEKALCDVHDRIEDTVDGDKQGEDWMCTVLYDAEIVRIIDRALGAGFAKKEQR